MNTGNNSLSKLLKHYSWKRFHEDFNFQQLCCIISSTKPKSRPKLKSGTIFSLHRKSLLTRSAKKRTRYSVESRLSLKLHLVMLPTPSTQIVVVVVRKNLQRTS